LIDKWDGANKFYIPTGCNGIYHNLLLINSDLNMSHDFLSCFCIYSPNCAVP
jgi:hypothetical protein